MSSFPVLTLPLLAQIRVLEQMDRNDLLVFSLLSKSSKNLAIAARRTIEHFKWDLRVLHQNSVSQNSLSFSSGHLIKIPMRNTVEEAREIKFLNFNGQLVPTNESCEYYKPIWNIGDRKQPTEQSYELMVKLSDHILEVFKCKDFCLSVYNRDAPEDLFVLKHTRRFKELGFTSHYPMSADDLKFVLEELEVERLNMNRPVSGSQWNGPLRMEELWAYQTEWLAFEAILNCECKYLYLGHNDFTDTQLNTFIQKWLDGGLKNLEYCQFVSRVESAEVILQGIQTTPIQYDKHPEEHPRDVGLLQYLQESSVDVRRSDGVLATILISPVESTFVLAKWD